MDFFFLARYHLQKVNQDQISNLNRPVTPSEIEEILNVSQTKKGKGQMLLAQNSASLSKKAYHQYCSNHSTTEKQKGQY